jgi:hypothetical protein
MDFGPLSRSRLHTSRLSRAPVTMVTMKSMPGRIYQYLADDHLRLDTALERAVREPDHIEQSAYAEFREGLLRHIAMEEKILLPAARSANGGQPLAAAATLHLDHAALAGLLVLAPTHRIITAIKSVLARHNPLEEGPGGVYEECERLIGPDIDAIGARLRNAPPVAVAKYVDNAIALESARHNLQKAGFSVEL